MSEISARDVKALRDRTGAGMLACRDALSESNGDLDTAVELLRARGEAQAAKRAGAETREGVVQSYIHAGNKIGAIVEVDCQTDFVARNDKFVEFARDVALHIAAAGQTIAITEGRITALTGSLLPPIRCAHQEEPIGRALEGLVSAGADLLLVIGASAVVDRRDVGPAGIVRAGGEILHFGMPVDPGNLICLGRIGERPALVLPGCARSPSLEKRSASTYRNESATTTAVSASAPVCLCASCAPAASPPVQSAPAPNSANATRTRPAMSRQSQTLCGPESSPTFSVLAVIAP